MHIEERLEVQYINHLKENHYLHIFPRSRNLEIGTFPLSLMFKLEQGEALD
jgi:hypothetical protein